MKFDLLRACWYIVLPIQWFHNETGSSTLRTIFIQNPRSYTTHLIQLNEKYTSYVPTFFLHSISRHVFSIPFFVVPPSGLCLMDG